MIPPVSTRSKSRCGPQNHPMANSAVAVTSVGGGRSGQMIAVEASLHVLLLLLLLDNWTATKLDSR